MAERELGTLEVRRIRFDKIRAAEYNPRVDLLPGDREWVEIEASLDEFGLVEPLVWNEATGNLVGGHQRLKIMKAKGRVEADFSVIHEPDPDRERALNIRLNGSQGRWDVGRLAAMLDDSEELRRLAGFAESDLQALRELSEVSAPLGFYEHLEQWSARPEPRAEGGPEDPGPQIDRAEELRARWGVADGQLWRIGQHRILCGDATQSQDVARLVGDDSCQCMWTDPPYGVEYVGKTREALRIQGDDPEATRVLLLAAWRVAPAALEAGSPFYIAAPSGPMGTLFRLSLADAEWSYHQSLVWVKNAMVLGHSDYHYQHEDILYGWTGLGKGEGRPGRGRHAGSRWRGDNAQKSVFMVDRPAASVEHPTMKPPELVALMLANSSRRGEGVYDPFAGSGSTMVACEQMGCRCFALEIDPRYVAVTLERLTGMGLEAERVE